jgi:single-stranded-DNA-specific exonuclease
VQLLAAESYSEALAVAKILEEENLLRRKIDQGTFEEADSLVRQTMTVEDASIVLHKEDWHPGVIGIVASRLVEQYYRPVIMMTTVDGKAKGSARSVSGFNIYEAIKKCESLLVQFGGHKYAAGLTVEPEKIGAFREAFSKVAAETLTDELLIPELRIDAEISLGDISPKFIRVLGQFAPFGPENMRPIFAVRDVSIVGTPRIVGKNHLKFKVKKGTFVIDAIGFNLGHLLEKVKPGASGVDLAFSLDENEYRGEVVPQLKIRDIVVNNGR